MENKYHIGTTVFGSWTIERELGKGSFGQVFEIGRNDFGEHYNAALKIITVPRDKSEVRSLEADGMSVAHTEEYFYSIVEDIVKEFAIMSKLKGTTNIVSYEDHQVVRHSEGIGWDILIRMELLTSLSSYIMEHPLTYRMVGQIGIDICRGLELCEKQRIVHRDIKPENIFVSPNGDFKLGDFGVARTMERAAPGSIKGTYNYMAPEVYRGGEYDHRVDLYSLGMVLYKYLNNNRFPFLPLTDMVRYQDTENAFVRRINGEMLPAPAYAPQQVADVILKACAYQPADRFSNATEMRQALESVLPFLADTPISTPSSGTVVLPPRPQPIPVPPSPQPAPVHMPPVAQKEKKKSKALPIVLGTVVLLGILFFAFLRFGNDFGLVNKTVYTGTHEVAQTNAPVETDAPVQTVTPEASVSNEEAEPLPAEAVFADGSKEIYTYLETGKLAEKTVYSAEGAFVARHVYTYDGDNLIREKLYNAAGKLAGDIVVAEDGSKTETVHNYDVYGKVTDGIKTVIDANGVTREEYTLNEYGDAISVEFYDEQGNFTLAREYHFTVAGYRNGYTDTDAAGKKTRYNEDGTVYKAPKPVVTPIEKPALTTATTEVTATTAKTTPPEPVNKQRIEHVTPFIDDVYDSNDNYIARITYYDEAHWRMKVYDDKVKQTATEYDWSDGSKKIKEERSYDYYGYVISKALYEDGVYIGKIDYDYYSDIGHIKEERHYDTSGKLIKTVQNKIITNKNGTYYVNNGRYTYSKWVNGKEESRLNYWYTK